MQPASRIISIPNPCSQSWDEMTPVEKGRFCQHCQKSVTDFSAMNDKQLIAAINLLSGDTCGRFIPSQLDRKLVPPATPRKSFFPAAVLASLLTSISPLAKAAVATSYVQLSADNTVEETKDSTGTFITGHITDDKCVAIVGATIKLKNTDIGAATDQQGNFRLFVPTAQVKEGFSLLIRSISFVTTEVKPRIDTQGNILPLQVTMENYVSGGGWAIIKQTRWQRFKSSLKRSFHRFTL